MGDQTWERDAELAGQIDRGDKSYVAMLAARCVEETVRGARGRGRSEFSDQKTSCLRFAEHSRISDKTVSAYLRTWDAMARDGVVPTRDELLPGVDVADLPDRDTWNKWYREANPAPENRHRPHPVPSKPRPEIPGRPHPRPHPPAGAARPNLHDERIIQNATREQETQRLANELHQVPRDLESKALETLTQRALDQGSAIGGSIGDLYQSVIGSALDINGNINPRRAYARHLNMLTELGTAINSIVKDAHREH
jgi:hypothetical protein